MRSTLLPFLILILLLPSSLTLSYKVTMDLTGNDNLITSYNVDVGSCSCDLHDSSCDIFCCCDSSCSSTQTSTWQSNNLCSTTKNNLEKSCDNLGSGGQLSFNDLTCVYYSNRGNISYFYSYPDSGSVNYPTPDKFVAKTASMEAINVLSSTATNTVYSDTQLLLKVNKTLDANLRYMEIWSPVASGSCGQGYVNISSSQTFSCEYALDSKTCPLSTSLFTAGMLVCKNGQCTDTQTFPSFTPSSSPSNICTNFLTSLTIDITVSSSGKTYKIDSILITPDFKDINMNIYKKYPVKTAINVKYNAATVSYSGNPGYLMSKAVTIEKSGAIYSIFNVADSSGNCVLSANTNTVSATDILFGQNAVFSCVNADPCNSALYIDQIAKQFLTIRKWAKSSDNASVQVSGTGSSVNTCNSQQVVLNILYSTSGWIADTQSYIVGAQITTKASSDSTWNKKYFRVNWIYVDPKTITNPPANYFYEYFSYIWKPLRDYFGVY